MRGYGFTGSVERVIALHDRGVIKKYPQVDFGSTKAQLTKKKVKTRKENKSIELLTFEKPSCGTIQQA